MTNGFHFRDFGFVPIESPFEFQEAELQELLALYHHVPDGISCGCCEQHGVRPRIFVCSTRRYFAPRREHAWEHSAGCIAALGRKRLGPDRDRPTIGALIDPKLPGAQACQLPASPVTFRDYVGRLVSHGLIDAWCRWPVSHAVDRAPDAQYIIRGIDSALRSYRFRSGEPGPVLAQGHGLSIRHGIIDHSSMLGAKRPGAGRVALLIREVFRVGEACQLRTEFICPDIELFEHALRGVQRFNNHTVPPWYFFAVVDLNGNVSRLVLMPVHFDGRDLIFVASGMERAQAARFLAAGILFFKPTHVRELRALGRVRPDLMWLGEITWRFWPDFVLLAPEARAIVELRGYRIATLPVYDGLMNRKTVYYTRPSIRALCGFAEIDGTLLKPIPTDSIAWESGIIHCDLRLPPLPSLVV